MSGNWTAHQRDYDGRTCWCVKDGQRVVCDLMTEEDARRVVRLLQGARAAYRHLDTYGVVSGPCIERELSSQNLVFDLLRDVV